MSIKQFGIEWGRLGFRKDVEQIKMIKDNQKLSEMIQNDQNPINQIQTFGQLDSKV